MKKYDLLSATVCLCLGLAFVIAGARMGIGPLQAPEAGFFPVAIGSALALLSVLLLVTSAFAKATGAGPRPFWKQKHSWVKVALVVAALLFYLAALEFLGYLATTTLFLLFLLKVVNKKNWATSLALALLVALASFALFKLALGVYLPKGLTPW